MAAIDNLLAAIRKHEAPKGYGQIYSGAKGISLATDVSTMTLNQIVALQRRMVKSGSASTACGGYQFIRKTLERTIDEMGLSGDQTWTPALQDRMAIHLMNGRGLAKYLSGQITAEHFANNLAMEWASLPVVTAVKGAKGRVLQPGQSYYAGDGLNKAFHNPADVLRLVKALNQPVEAQTPQPAPMPAPGTVDAPGPVPEPAKPMGLLAALLALLKAIFSRKV